MTSSAKTLRALDVEAIGLLLNTFCYKPGETAGFQHILYCRWCSYAQSHPHDKGCIVTRYAAALKRKRTGLTSSRTLKGGDSHNWRSMSRAEKKV